MDIPNFKAVVSFFIAIIMALPFNTTSLEELTKPENTEQGVEWFLDVLDDRKEELVPTALNWILLFINENLTEHQNLSAEEKTEYLFDLLDSMLSESWPPCDEGYYDENGNPVEGSEIDWKTIVPFDTIVFYAPEFEFDCSSVDAVFNSVKNFADVKNKLGGDIANLDFSALLTASGEAQTRANTGDLQLIYNVFEFLNDNTAIVQKFFNGTLNLGVFADKYPELQAELYTLMSDGLQGVKDLFSDFFNNNFNQEEYYPEEFPGVNEASSSTEPEEQPTEEPEIDCTGWTIDQIMGAAFIALIEGDFPSIEKVDEFLNTSVYDILAKVISFFYNDTFLPMLQDYVVSLRNNMEWNEMTFNEYLDSFNSSEVIDADCINIENYIDDLKVDFVNAENGIFGEVNNIVVLFVEKILTDSAFEDLQLKKGGVAELNKNIEKILKFALDIISKLCEDCIENPEKYIGGEEVYDESITGNENSGDNIPSIGVEVVYDIPKYVYELVKYNYEYTENMTTSEIVSVFIKYCMQSIYFGPEYTYDEDGNIVEISEINSKLKYFAEHVETIPEFISFWFYYLLTVLSDMGVMSDVIGYDYLTEWNSLIFEDDGETLKDLSTAQWGEVWVSVSVDILSFFFASDDYFAKNFTGFDIKDLKAAKVSGWTSDALLDEIVDWAINLVGGVPAALDGVSCERGVLDGFGPRYKINVILNELFNFSFLNCSSETFVFDLEKFVLEGLFENICELDISGILGLFTIDGKQDTLLNKNIVPMVLDIISNIFTSIFEHECVPATVVLTDCANNSKNIEYCGKCGIYTSELNSINPGGHTLVTTVNSVADCKKAGLVTYTCKTCDYKSEKVIPITGHDDMNFDNLCDVCSVNMLISGICGDNLTWTLNSAGILTISGSGDMFDYDDAYVYVNENSENIVPWYNYRNKIQKIIIEDGVTSIGSYSISRNDFRIVSVIIPLSVKAVHPNAKVGSGYIVEKYYYGSEEEWNAIERRNLNNDAENFYDGNNFFFTDGVFFNYTNEHVHDFTERKKITAPTCTEQGYTTYYCSCGESRIGDFTEPKHNYTANITVTEPTCTEQGYTAYYCSCGESIVDNYKEPKHKFGEWTVTVAPSVFDGEEKRVCAVCNISESRKIDKLPTILENEDIELGLIGTENAFDGDVTLSATELTEGTTHESFAVLGYKNFACYEIEVLQDGTAVQPNEKIWVRIPLPTDANPNDILVYYIQPNGGMIRMNSFVDGGYVYFETDHFSTYVVVDESSKEEPFEPNPGGSDDTNTCSHICHKDGFVGFIWKIINFFGKLFKINPICECGVTHW